MCFWSWEFEFRSDRLVLKITDANSMIDWFDENYDLDIVYLSRHPIPQALSCIRNGWTLHVRPFLRNERFVRRHLDAALARYAHEVLETARNSNASFSIGRSRTSSRCACSPTVRIGRSSATSSACSSPNCTVRRHRSRARAHRCRCDATQARGRHRGRPACPRVRPRAHRGRRSGVLVRSWREGRTRRGTTARWQSSSDSASTCIGAAMTCPPPCPVRSTRDCGDMTYER